VFERWEDQKMVTTDTILPRNPEFDNYSSDSLRVVLRKGIKKTLAYRRGGTKEIELVPDHLVQQNGNKVMGLIEKDNMEVRNNKFTIPRPSLWKVRKKLALCAGENTWDFCEQPGFVECTAFAISEWLVVTAGHCINPYNGWKDYYFVYGNKTRDKDAIYSFSQSQVYEATELVERIQDDNGLDIAVVRVNKKIPRSKIVTVSSKAFNPETSVYMIGHPLGVPLKYSKCRKITENSNINYFLAEMDSFMGNSGSPVFNRSEGCAEGMLVSGDLDFLRDIKKDNCKLFVVCGENFECRGEKVIRLSEIMKLTKVQNALKTAN
jgi:hypothetical protein